MDTVAIVSIIYKEPEWDATERCLDRCGFPKFFVDRKGTGSLAKALNAGFLQWGQGFQYIWFVTNVTFSHTCLISLVEAMEMNPEFAGITPAFWSDHLFTRPAPGKTGVASVPFIEFTAPIVRTSVFRDFPLDERMPYWGHDLDWGYRVRSSGHRVGVLYDETLGHEYIRNNKNECLITTIRKGKRQQTNESTRKALFEKYGPDWRKVLAWQG